MSRRILVTLLGMLAIAGLSGCSNKPTSTSLGTMNIQMTDAPGDFQEVNLVVNEVAVQSSNGNGGWEVLSSQSRTYDLLQLRNGVFATLGISQLPAGHYNQLRLKLGAGSYVVVDNTRHPLRVPSGMQSGLKLTGSFDVPLNGRVDLALDFDVARSVLPDGDGAYSLKPTIRVVTVSLPDNRPGAIHGVVAPTGAMASVFVIQNADTVASTLNGADGNFTVLLLPAGTYDLEFHAHEGYLDHTVNGVVVNMGATTDVGTIALSPVPPPPPTTGAVVGHVMPAGVPTMVSAIAGGSIVAQVAASTDGAFALAGLPAGSYVVYFQPSTDFLEKSVGGITVVAGQTNDLGAVQLEAVPPPPPPPPPPPQLPGAISGQLMPPGIPSVALAMQGELTVGQTPVEMNGTFTIADLPVGTYTVVVHPLFDFLDLTVPNVVVNSGATTNLGTLMLQY